MMRSDDMVAVLVGIAGGTGAGKSWLAEALVRALSPVEAALLRQDDYLLPLPEAVRHAPLRHNFDHPDAYDWELLATHLESLQTGRAVAAPIFEGRSHSRARTTRRVGPAPVVVVEGLHVLGVVAVRDRLDLKAFVDTPADIRLVRRLEKDCTTRGRSWSQVTDQYLGIVRPMHEQHVEPSRGQADLVVSGAGAGDAALANLCNRVRALLHLAF